MLNNSSNPCTPLQSLYNYLVFSSPYLQDEQAQDLSPRSAHGRGGKLSVLASHLMFRHDQTPHVSRRVLCVLLLAVFFINPLSLFLPRGDASISHQLGSVRSLSGIDMDQEIPQPRYMADSIIYLLLWALKLLIAAGVFGWMTLRSFPTVPPSSKGAVRFWRYKMQAEKDMQKVGGILPFCRACSWPKNHWFVLCPCRVSFPVPARTWKRPLKSLANPSPHRPLALSLDCSGTSSHTSCFR